MDIIFEKPSDLFRWSLQHVNTRHPVFTYQTCFPLYYKMACHDGYIWANYDRRLDDIMACIGPGASVLEIGCGFGHDSHWAAARGAHVTAIDVNSDFISIARELTVHIARSSGRKLTINFQRSNLLFFLSPSKFDVIFMKDVFHHLEPRNQVVDKLASLLNPGGRLVIVEPNALNPLIQWKMFRIRGLRTILKKYDSSTGESYLFGNERLVTGLSLRREFLLRGVVGTSRTFRLLPTALSASPRLVALAQFLENAGLEFISPFCIHCVFSGEKVI